MNEAKTQSESGSSDVKNETKRSLVRKVAEVMALADRIPKSGTNEFHHYKYATEADVLDAVRVEMAKRQLTLTPSVIDSKSELIGEKKNRLVTIRVRYTIEDGESGEQRQFDMLGEGSDSLDKAFYKAMTGCTKYAVLKFFMLGTGDDPEKEPRREIPPPAGLSAIKSKLPAGSALPGSPEAAGAPAAHDRAFVFKFANKENLPLHSLTEKSLRWFENTLKQNVADPAKANYVADNTQKLALVQAEIRFRGLA